MIYNFDFGIFIFILFSILKDPIFYPILFIPPRNLNKDNFFHSLDISIRVSFQFFVQGFIEIKNKCKTSNRDKVPGKYFPFSFFLLLLQKPGTR